MSVNCQNLPTGALTTWFKDKGYYDRKVHLSDLWNHHFWQEECCIKSVSHGAVLRYQLAQNTRKWKCGDCSEIMLPCWPLFSPGPKCKTRASEGRTYTLAQCRGKISAVSGMHGNWSMCEDASHVPSSVRKQTNGCQCSNCRLLLIQSGP